MGHGQGGKGHKGAPQAKALDEAGPGRVEKIDLEVIEAHEIDRQAVNQQPYPDQQAAVHPGGETAHHGHHH